MSNQLTEFRSFVSDTHGLILWATGAGILGTLVAGFAGVAPPWPEAATAITCAAQLIVLMFSFLNNRGVSRRISLERFRRSVIVAAILLITYLALYSTFVVHIPTTGDAVVSGFRCTTDALEVYANCPFLGVEELAHANYSVELVWTKPSISVVRIALFVAWLGVFSFYIYAAATFVIYSRGRKSSQVT